jgi:hypothetical protein
MQAVEMPRLGRENLPIHRFRIGQSTGPMERQSLRQCRGRRHGAGYLLRGDESPRIFLHHRRLDDSSTHRVNARQLPDGLPGLIWVCGSFWLPSESTAGRGIMAVD